jgi:transposase
MDFISGESRNQIVLLPDSIDDYVDDNNSVRVIDAFVNNLKLNELGFSRSKPNDTGRPMYDPKDLLKLYVYGYMNKIRSSRRLETETKRNLELIWLLGKLSPDHKTIARFRHDNADALKNVFRDFVKLCMKLNLYGRELVAIDGSKFKAVNSKDRNFGAKKLEERIARIEVKIEEYLSELEDSDSEESVLEGEKSSEEIAQIIVELAARKERYQSYADELKQTGVLQKSLTDPDSRLMMANGKMDVCYNVQTAVDEKNKLIAEFEVTNIVIDKNLLSRMAAQTAETLETPDLAVTADKGYDSASDIVKCLRNGIDVHVCGAGMDVCVPSDKPEEDITSHTNGRTVYIPERNIAICPMGKVLYPSHYINRIGKAAFSNYAECYRCPCKCTKSKGIRFEIDIPKESFTKIYDDKNLFFRQIHIKPDDKLLKLRKSIVEHPFGTIKRSMDAGYCLTRGLRNVSGEFSLAFLAYNLKRVINILGVKKLIECME